MLLIHFVVVIMLALIFTLVTIFHRDKGPIPPFLAFISWVSAAYQSLMVELPYATTASPVQVVYEPYHGGAGLAMYFFGIGVVMFLFFIDSILDFVRKER